LGSDSQDAGDENDDSLGDADLVVSLQPDAGSVGQGGWLGEFIFELAHFKI